MWKTAWTIRLKRLWLKVQSLFAADYKPILFNIFINDTNNVTGSTLSKFAGETNLGEEVNALERKADTQRKFSAAEKLDDRNLKKFKGKMDPGQTHSVA